MTEQSVNGPDTNLKAFEAQLAARILGKATCVETWPRNADGDRVLVGLAEGTLLVLAPAEDSSENLIGHENRNQCDPQRRNSSLLHADSGTGSALGGGTAFPTNGFGTGSSGLLSAAVSGITGAAAAATAAVGGAASSAAPNYASYDSNSSGSDTPWRVQRAFREFGGGRTLLQMQLLLSRQVLLSLCDQGVSVHRVPSFQLTCQANRARNGKCFAWQESRAVLCCAVKRRLYLLHYDGKDFLELRDFTAAHSPVRMEWLDSGILLAYQTGYSLMNSQTGEQTHLATTPKGSHPAFAVLGGGEFLLSLEGQCQIFGSDGRPTKRVMTWSTSPTSFIFSQPLLAALLPSCLEIRSLRSAAARRVLQTVAAPGLLSVSPHATCDGTRFAVSPTEVWQLRATPLPQQAQQLAAQKRVEEALDLLSLCHSPDEARQCKVLEDSLHVQLGHQLFKSGAFEEAMVHYGMGRSANPVTLLLLFPSLAPDHLLQPVAHLFQEYEQSSEVVEPTGETYTAALNKLLPYLLSWRTRLAAAASATPSSQMPRQQEVPQGGASPQSIHSEAALDGSTPSQCAHSQRSESSAGSGRESRSFREKAPSPGGPPAPSPAAAVAPELQQLTIEQQGSLAVLLDTAVLKAMLALPDTGQLLRFVKGDNSLDLSVGRSSLEAAGRYSELVALLRGRGCHDEALHLLRQLSQSPHDLPVPAAGAATDLVGMPGVWAAVHYIMAIGPDYTALIRQHSRWVLEADSEAGIDMLAQMAPPIAPADALRIVSDCAPHLVISYLEAALQAGAATHQEFDTPLAVNYLERALLHESAVQAPSLEQQQEKGFGLSSEAALGRLKALVVASSHIDADRLLKQLPARGLLEVRALLLEHFHRHIQILRIYVDELRRADLAEAYCDRVYVRRGMKVAGPSARDGVDADAYVDDCDDPGDIYLQLLQVYLQPPLSASNAAADVTAKLAIGRQIDMARMLSRKHDRLDAGRALHLLPPEMALETAQRFLVAALQGRGELQRGASIVRSLQRASNLAARSELISRRQRSFVVTEERACGVCFKRIGTSAVVVSPDGQFLQHYSCFLRTADASNLAPVKPYS